MGSCGLNTISFSQQIYELVIPRGAKRIEYLRFVRTSPIGLTAGPRIGLGTKMNRDRMAQLDLSVLLPLLNLRPRIAQGHRTIENQRTRLRIQVGAEVA